MAKINPGKYAIYFASVLLVVAVAFAGTFQRTDVFILSAGVGLVSYGAGLSTPLTLLLTGLATFLGTVLPFGVTSTARIQGFEGFESKEEDFEEEDFEEEEEKKVEGFEEEEVKRRRILRRRTRTLRKRVRALKVTRTSKKRTSRRQRRSSLTTKALPMLVLRRKRRRSAAHPYPTMASAPRCLSSVRSTRCRPNPMMPSFTWMPVRRS